MMKFFSFFVKFHKMVDRYIMYAHFARSVGGLIDTHNCLLIDNLPYNKLSYYMIYYVNYDIWISFAMASVGKYFCVPLIYPHFYPLRLKKV